MGGTRRFERNNVLGPSHSHALHTFPVLVTKYLDRVDFNSDDSLINKSFKASVRRTRAAIFGLLLCVVQESEAHSFICSGDSGFIKAYSFIALSCSLTEQYIDASNVKGIQVELLNIGNTASV
ncbi:hypothetical protein L2E82_01639 [Cichorium intybus]|uniref:Uncharacterized protein n=1 Tax=Cichorium intybus TaxID=13427 RepID=A0ACB9H0I8_CICIN|nr:hypothetical protein L2E82_01639 [Cichorium intybus]